MLVPSIGLAILVHVIVIGWHKAFRWVPKRNKRQGRYAEGALHSMGFAVALFISFSIFTFAASVVYASIIDRHSSIYAMKNLAVGAYGIFAADHSHENESLAGTQAIGPESATAFAAAFTAPATATEGFGSLPNIVLKKTGASVPSVPTLTPATAVPENHSGWEPWLDIARKAILQTQNEFATETIQNTP